MFVAT